MKTAVRTLIVGFGNVLRGDDGFGVEVIKRLAGSALPPHVETLDVGIGGMHCVLKLMEGFAEVIVVDAMQGEQAPGTLSVFTPAAAALRVTAGEPIDPHFAEPVCALQLAAALGVLPHRVTFVGCEPDNCDVGMEFSWVVHAAVDRAVATIQQMVGAAVHGH